MALCADRYVRGIIVVRHVHGIVIVGSLLPTHRFHATLDDGLKTAALHIVGRRHSSEVEHCRRKVDILDDCIATSLGFDTWGIANNQGHAHRLFVGPALVNVVMLSKIKALVAGVDDHGIIVESFCF